MKRTAIKRSDKPMKRSRINPVSAKRRRAAADRDLVREAVFIRDGHRCVLRKWHHPTLHVPMVHTSVLTVHHIKKASAGGLYEESNLVSLCSGCNSWVEDRPGPGYALGLTCLSGESIEECWATLRENGLVL